MPSLDLTPEEMPELEAALHDQIENLKRDIQWYKQFGGPEQVAKTENRLRITTAILAKVTGLVKKK